MMRMAWNIGGIGVLGSLLLGCGDPVPPAAQAGISIQIQPYTPDDPTWGKFDCPPYHHWLNIPHDRDARSPNTQRQQTDANQAVRAVNNQDGNTVSCSVKPRGSGFVVKGDATAYAENSGVKYKQSIVHLIIPEIQEGDTSAKGSLTVQDDASLNPYSSDDCLYSVQGGMKGVEAGKIWGSLTCHGLTDPKAINAACRIENGFFVLENCAK